MKTGIFLILIGLILLSYSFESAECYFTSSKMKRDYDYNFFSGCLIKTQKGFIPLENFRLIEVE